MCYYWFVKTGGKVSLNSIQSLNDLNNFLKVEIEALKSLKGDFKGREVDMVGSMSQRIETLAQTIKTHESLINEEQDKLTSDTIDFMKSIKTIKELRDNSCPLEGGGEEEFQKVFKATTVLFENLGIENLDQSKSTIQEIKKVDSSIYYQVLAGWIEKKKIPLKDLKMSEEEILELAPYLTYLNLSDGNTSSLEDCTFKADFIGKLLEKSESLNELVIIRCKISGSEISRLKNVDKLQNLTIQDCKDFQDCLPEEMRSLKSLEILDCRLYNQKLPQELPNLTSLTLNGCEAFNQKLSEEIPKLRHLTIGKCPDFNQELPLKFTKLWTLKITECPALIFKRADQYKFLSSDVNTLTSRNRLRIKSLSTSMGISDNQLSVFKHFNKNHDELSEEFFQVLDDLDVAGIIRELKNENVHEFLKEKIPNDPIKQLCIRYLCTKLNEEDIKQRLEPFFECFVKDAMDEDIHAFCQSVSQSRRLYIPDNTLKLEEFSPTERLQILSYLSLEKEWEVMVKNIFQLQKSKLWKPFMQLFPSDKSSARKLQISDLFTGNDLEDSKTIKKLIEEIPEHFLTESRLQNLIKELYPPIDTQNKALYPIVSNMVDDTLGLSIIPEMPLLYPDDILNLLKMHKQVKGFGIHYFASPGIDEGGLSRQFVAQAVQGICTRSKNFQFEKLHSKETGALSLIPINAFNPSAMMSKEEVQGGLEQDKENYFLLGRFFGLAIKNDCPIGEVFNRKFFNTLFLFTDNDLDKETFSARDYLASRKPQELMDFIREYLTEVDETKSMQELFKNVESVLNADKFEDVKSIAEELNEIWFDENLERALEEEKLENVKKCVVLALADNYYGRLEVMQAIAKGMRAELPFEVGDITVTKWDELKKATSEQFADTLQGKFSVDLIKKNLNFKADDSDKAKNLEKWMHKWLDDNKDNPESIRNVIITCTGSTAIVKPITFWLVETVVSIFPHTCSLDVHVPEDIDEESFCAALDGWGNKPELMMTQA